MKIHGDIVKACTINKYHPENFTGSIRLCDGFFYFYGGKSQSSKGVHHEIIQISKIYFYNNHDFDRFFIFTTWPRQCPTHPD